MFHDTPESQAGVTPVITSGQDNAAANRFQEPSPEGPTPVETAIEISEKYVKLTEEASMLREQNNQLNKHNTELNAKLDTANEKLSRAERELKEANDMLIDMRIELNNWKMDVLSFRDEMRNADKAELQALLKILKTLGGDMNIEDSTLANEILSEPNEPQT
jgi:predicted RNase H-like nuclease (RuvC/YqgF family)